VLQGGTDEEILEWCFEKGRRLNQGDLVVWNVFDFEVKLARFRHAKLGGDKAETWHCGPR
jgi:hypothetical protein